jgi:hypothetical protein
VHVVLLVLNTGLSLSLSLSLTHTHTHTQTHTHHTHLLVDLVLLVLNYIVELILKLLQLRVLLSL